MISLRLIHVVGSINSLFLCCCWLAFYWLRHTMIYLSTHLLKNNLSCFQYLSISSKVVKRMKDEPQRRWENICKACIQKKTCTTEVKVKVLAAQSCPTLCNPMNYSPPGFSDCGILQARILEWVAVPFCRGSSCPSDWTQKSCTAGRFFTIWATREVQDWHFLGPQKRFESYENMKYFIWKYLNNKKTTQVEKENKFTQPFHQRRHTNDKQAHEKIFSIIIWRKCILKPEMRYLCIHTRMAKVKRSDLPSMGKDGEELEPSYTICGMSNGAAALENNGLFLKKLNICCCRQHSSLPTLHQMTSC